MLRAQKQSKNKLTSRQHRVTASKRTQTHLKKSLKVHSTPQNGISSARTSRSSSKSTFLSVIKSSHQLSTQGSPIFNPTPAFFSAPLFLPTSFSINSPPQFVSKRFFSINMTSVIPSLSESTTGAPKSLEIPTTTAHSDGEDHDHGAFERKPPSDPSHAMNITIVDRENINHVMPCKVGDNILQLMRLFQEKHPQLYLEGACESSLACSTCHVILDSKSYDTLQKLKESTEKEEDMLDMASCLTPTSRLGCQVNLVKELDGATFTLPKFSRNFYVDGHVPQPH